MSAEYRAVQWNRAKLVYDAVLLAAVALFIGGFAAIAWRVEPPQNLPGALDLWLRAFGVCAFLMLTMVLSIGPLARLSPRFLPLLYNRRHFGVLTFCVAAIHAWFLFDYYWVLNDLPKLGAQFANWPAYAKFIGFPFKTLGLAALLILFLMASTSHDFWLNFLSPRIWKGLHMAVYLAYGLVVIHVALGIMQYESTPLIPLMLAGGFGAGVTLHLWAGWRERKMDRGAALTGDGWIAVGRPREIPDKGARITAAPGGERIAVFRDGNIIGALTNLCAHQNGPLGEGRIVDGCVTCPWHGFQYRLADGCAPPPYTEKLATYRVRVKRGVVEVDPRPLPPGTPAAIACPPGTL